MHAKKILLKKSLKSSPSFKKAFSLVEISIVLLIIGILIAATISAKTLIKNSRIKSAQAITRSAPVNSIPNSVIWLESSLEESFDTSESEDGNSLTSWQDIKTGSSNETNNGSSGSDNPTFSNTINSIHAVKFSGSSDSYFEIDGSALNNSDYTIIFLEKRQATGANYFLSDDGTSENDNETIQLGYSGTSAVIHSQGSGNNHSTSVGEYNSGQKPRIFTFIQNISTGKKIYLNGFLISQDNDTTQLSGIDKLHLGKDYTGEIGEFMVFDRALKSEERSSIETYLATKWKVDNTASSGSNDCSSGVVADSGCEMLCSAPSVNGITSSAKISDGASSNYSCDASGYASGNTPTYTCSSGSLSPTPLAGDCTTTNGCATNHNIDDSSCKAKCDITGETGIVDATKVDSGSVSFDCNDSGYTGSITYQCDGGSLTSVNNSCTPVAGPACSGGDIVDTETVPGDVIHIFTSVGSEVTLDCTESVSGAKILIVAGGGSGGAVNNNNGGAGGGGAGGLVYASSYNLSVASYNVIVGKGGDAQPSQAGAGNNGDNSQFNDLIADGGGGGGAYQDGIGHVVEDGGSGGGSDWQIVADPGVSTQTDQPSANGNGIGYGNNGGTDVTDLRWPGAGGGGAGDVGGNTIVSPKSAGDGGIGMQFDITGMNKYYAAGGGGGAGGIWSSEAVDYGIGGSGIGGNGSGSTTHQATDGAINTGSGGGGNSYALSSGAGGSGIVIVRYTNP